MLLQRGGVPHVVAAPSVISDQLALEYARAFCAHAEGIRACSSGAAYPVTAPYLPRYSPLLTPLLPRYLPPYSVLTPFLQPTPADHPRHLIALTPFCSLLTSHGHSFSRVSTPPRPCGSAASTHARPCTPHVPVTGITDARPTCRRRFSIFSTRRLRLPPHCGSPRERCIRCHLPPHCGSP